MPEPIAYAGPQTYAFPRSYQVLGVVSLIAAAMSIVACGWLILDNIGTPSDSLPGCNAVLGVMILIALVLMTGAVMLCRRDARGLFLHRIYTVFQLCASVVLACVAMAEIYDSPAGMIFFVGIIPGAIAAIYPIVLIILWWQAKVVRVIPQVIPGVIGRVASLESVRTASKRLRRR